MADVEVVDGAGINNADDEQVIAEMQERLRDMENEVGRLKEQTASGPEGDAAYQPPAAENAPAVPAPLQNATEGEDTNMEGESKEAIDARSVYVGNVDYSATPEDIQSHFASCGTINRVTILCDKFTGHPKGFAYVEFAEPGFVDHAVVLDNSTFHGRSIKVTPKRTNLPGFNRGRGRGRGGYRGGGYRGGGRGYSPYGSRGRGRGRGY